MPHQRRSGIGSNKIILEIRKNKQAPHFCEAFLRNGRESFLSLPTILLSYCFYHNFITILNNIITISSRFWSVFE